MGNTVVVVVVSDWAGTCGLFSFRLFVIITVLLLCPFYYYFALFIPRTSWVYAVRLSVILVVVVNMHEEILGNSRRTKAIENNGFEFIQETLWATRCTLLTGG